MVAALKFVTHSKAVFAEPIHSRDIERVMVQLVRLDGLSGLLRKIFQIPLGIKLELLRRS